MIKGSNDQMIDHRQPPRTARTWRGLPLPMMLTPPSLKFTDQALVEPEAKVEDDQ